MNAHDLTGACAAGLKDFPLYSQEKKADPLVGVKLFHWAATIILAGGTTTMMAGGEESKAA